MKKKVKMRLVLSLPSTIAGVEERSKRTDNEQRLTRQTPLFLLGQIVKEITTIRLNHQTVVCHIHHSSSRSKTESIMFTFMFSINY